MTMAPAQNTDHAGCPPAEELSAWFDGESTNRLKPHIDQCPHCQTIVDAYRRIAEVARTAAEAPDELADRIIRTCRASRHAPPPAVITFPRIAAAAAAVVILAAIGVTAWRTIENTAANDVIAQKTSGTPGLAATSAPSRGNLTPLPPASHKPSGLTVHSNQLAQAGVQSSRMSARGGRIRAQRIPDRVLHVWVVDNLDQGRRFLMAHLPKDARIAGEQSQNQMQEFVLRVRDDRLPTLVRELSGAGWRLLSPTPPQPDAPGRVAWIVRRRPVEYRLRVVQQTDSAP